jgi:hypothetical protein
MTFVVTSSFLIDEGCPQCWTLSSDVCPLLKQHHYSKSCIGLIYSDSLFPKFCAKFDTHYSVLSYITNIMQEQHYSLWLLCQTEWLQWCFTENMSRHTKKSPVIMWCKVLQKLIQSRYFLIRPCKCYRWNKGKVLLEMKTIKLPIYCHRGHLQIRRQIIEDVKLLERNLSQAIFNFWLS